MRPARLTDDEVPFLVIEVLSEEDRFSSFWGKLNEIEALGTRHIWVIDPRRHELFTFRDGSLLHVKGDVLTTDDPHLELTRGEIFNRMRPLA